MSDKKIEYLGIEFYRNFIGIEKPLIVLDSESGLEYSVTIDNLTAIIEYKADCKPRLKLPEDLMDEEIKIIIEKSCNRDLYIEKIEKSDWSIEIQATQYFDDEEMSSAKYEIMFSFEDAVVLDDDGCDIDVIKFLNGLRECHCVPNAKELIDKNLAVRI